MLLDIEIVKSKDYYNEEVQDLVRKGYHLKEAHAPPQGSPYYSFVLVKPKLPKKEWELNDS